MLKYFQESFSANNVKKPHVRQNQQAGDYLDLPKELKGSSPLSAQENVQALAREVSTILTEELKAA